jgi:cysteine desulfurase
VPATTPIYLDYQATTPVDTRVLQAMYPYFTECFGNAASAHSLGLSASEAVERARRQVAGAIGAQHREIVFLSGATEANNLALKGIARARGERREIISLATEHPAVLDPLRVLVGEGFDVTLLDVDSDGEPDLGELEGRVGERTLMVSIAAANNEVGTLPRLGSIAEIAHAHGALLHTDAAQAVGKIDIDVVRDGIDLLSFSGHKLYAPKGVGALYVRSEHRGRLRPLLDGGGQERGLRSGTLNVPGIVGLGEACALAQSELATEGPRLAGLRQRFLEQLSDSIGDVELNGPGNRRLPGNLNIRIPGVDGEALMANCPELAFSTGSACSAATPGPSSVLLALGLGAEEAEESARFGFGRPTTTAEVDRAVEAIAGAVGRLRRASRLGAGRS